MEELSLWQFAYLFRLHKFCLQNLTKCTLLILCRNYFVLHEINVFTYRWNW